MLLSIGVSVAASCLNLYMSIDHYAIIVFLYEPEE